MTGIGREYDVMTAVQIDSRKAAPAPAHGWHDDMRVSVGGDVDEAEALARAEAILRREGVVVLDDLVDPALLEQCRHEIGARYPDYDQRDHDLHLGAYPGRYTVPVVIDGTLADRAIFAPRAIMRISAKLLGTEHILESLGLLVSLPGAPDQQGHFDGLLFREMQLDRVLPPFAISVSMPLVRLDDTTGSTAFWRRSHHQGDRGGPPDFAPIVPVGSAVLWDFRTFHGGLANRSERPRPIIFSVHGRPWWQEPRSVEATRYKKLQLARAVRDGLSDRLRALTIRADMVD